MRYIRVNPEKHMPDRDIVLIANIHSGYIMLGEVVGEPTVEFFYYRDLKQPFTAHGYYNRRTEEYSIDIRGRIREATQRRIREAVIRLADEIQHTDRPIMPLGEDI